MWDQFVVNPMLNAMLLLYDFLGNNLLLAIAVFTIIIRLITLPLNIRQQRSMMKTQELQPQIQAIQKKYKDNPQKMQEEFAKIGYNPADTLTGCLPLIIQMPILFGMFQVFRIMLGTTPQALFELTQRVYPGIDLSQILPINNQFFIWNLGQPDPFLILPILVFVTMFVQQKYLSPTPKKAADKNKKQDDPTAAMTQSMQYTMPIMFAFFSLQFQAGLSLYFIFSNIIGILQGLYMRQIMGREEDVKPAVAAVEPVMREKPEPPSADANGQETYKAKPPTSKRKRRSAKR
ncbi:MAG: membrane protein insertase YidC [Ardenticatenaceae bacterium]|nr:membrane protein insertase YidC [Ardenticatenaceae bacterium]